MEENNRPEIYTPKDFKSSASSEGTNNTNQMKIANSTLKDINEVLRTVNSIAENFGFSVKELMKAKQEQPTSNATKIEAGIDKRMSEMQSQEVASSPIPIQQQVIKQGRLQFDAQKACIEIMQSITKLDDKKTGLEIKQMIGAYNEAGFLEGTLEELVNKHVKIVYE